MSVPSSLVTTESTRDPRIASAPERERHVSQLGDAIATLAARLHAATYELLVMLREFDACAGWNNGCLSCAHWLHWRTGIDLGAAREKVRVARALAALPSISAAMRRGEVSYAKVRALTRSQHRPTRRDSSRSHSQRRPPRLNALSVPGDGWTRSRPREKRNSAICTGP